MDIIKRAIPLLLFIGVAILLWRGLSLHPNEVPSPLINKPAPAFELPTLADRTKLTSNKDFIGHITLLNIWATWCVVCAEEHTVLAAIAEKNPELILMGLNYKDDQDAAKKWLQQRGNPYKVVGVDQTGSSAIDWGVYGTPETYIIDKKGFIRYKYIGPITFDVWERILKPLIQELKREP